MHHPTYRIAHTTAFVKPVMEHWFEREIVTLLEVNEKEEWPIGPLKTCSGLEPIPRCEPSTYQPISWWFTHCTIGARLYLWSFLNKREMFYLTTHSIHFIYGYMASDIWLRTILIVRKETCYRHIGYSYRLTARVLLYAPSHKQDSTYHCFCYTSRGALAGTRNSSMGPPHEGSIRWPIAPWANALPLSYVPLLALTKTICY